jgi:hypothetical protein
VELKIVDSISHETVRKDVKKNELSLTAKSQHIVYSFRLNT